MDNSKGPNKLSTFFRQLSLPRPHRSKSSGPSRPYDGSPRPANVISHPIIISNSPEAFYGEPSTRRTNPLNFQDDHRHADPQESSPYIPPRTDSQVALQFKSSTLPRRYGGSQDALPPTQFKRRSYTVTKASPVPSYAVVRKSHALNQVQITRVPRPLDDSPVFAEASPPRSPRNPARTEVSPKASTASPAPPTPSAGSSDPASDEWLDVDPDRQQQLEDPVFEPAVTDFEIRRKRVSIYRTRTDDNRRVLSIHKPQLHRYSRVSFIRLDARHYLGDPHHPDAPPHPHGLPLPLPDHQAGNSSRPDLVSSLQASDSSSDPRRKTLTYRSPGLLRIDSFSSVFSHDDRKSLDSVETANRQSYHYETLPAQKIDNTHIMAKLLSKGQRAFWGTVKQIAPQRAPPRHDRPRHRVARPLDDDDGWQDVDSVGDSLATVAAEALAPATALPSVVVASEATAARLSPFTDLNKSADSAAPPMKRTPTVTFATVVSEISIDQAPAEPAAEPDYAAALDSAAGIKPKSPKASPRILNSNPFGFSRSKKRRSGQKRKSDEAGSRPPSTRLSKLFHKRGFAKRLTNSSFKIEVLHEGWDDLDDVPLAQLAAAPIESSALAVSAASVGSAVTIPAPSVGAVSPSQPLQSSDKDERGPEAAVAVESDLLGVRTARPSASRPRMSYVAQMVQSFEAINVKEASQTSPVARKHQSNVSLLKPLAALKTIGESNRESLTDSVLDSHLTDTLDAIASYQAESPSLSLRPVADGPEPSTDERASMASAPQPTIELPAMGLSAEDIIVFKEDVDLAPLTLSSESSSSNVGRSTSTQQEQSISAGSSDTHNRLSSDRDSYSDQDRAFFDSLNVIVSEMMKPKRYVDHMSPEAAAGSPSVSHAADGSSTAIGRSEHKSGSPFNSLGRKRTARAAVVLTEDNPLIRELKTPPLRGRSPPAGYEDRPAIERQRSMQRAVAAGGEAFVDGTLDSRRGRNISPSIERKRSNRSPFVEGDAVRGPRDPHGHDSTMHPQAPVHGIPPRNILRSPDRSLDRKPRTIEPEEDWDPYPSTAAVDEAAVRKPFRSIDRSLDRKRSNRVPPPPSSDNPIIREPKTEAEMAQPTPTRTPRSPSPYHSLERKRSPRTVPAASVDNPLIWETKTTAEQDEALQSYPSNAISTINHYQSMSATRTGSVRQTPKPTPAEVFFSMDPYEAALRRLENRNVHEPASSLLIPPAQIPSMSRSRSNTGSDSPSLSGRIPESERPRMAIATVVPVSHVVPTMERQSSRSRSVERKATAIRVLSTPKMQTATLERVREPREEYPQLLTEVSARPVDSVAPTMDYAARPFEGSSRDQDYPHLSRAAESYSDVLPTFPVPPPNIPFVPVVLTTPAVSAGHPATAPSMPRAATATPPLPSAAKVSPSHSESPIYPTIGSSSSTSLLPTASGAPAAPLGKKKTMKAPTRSATVSMQM
ncbi:uncharacterized protein BJ171DRAFT_567207 [Polychytrium aggregatum]|uniref:uncharacterized protein n=1 Tax=Polychytrium aggregatum TaxID=110093 RepID=UPI0022FE4191|nr:uncharacterized protein BJ171DRAFT_567207 [Polychytrium aggregatum]KAI9205911.1 hypothetical protein BJ171DRAFT_567207 [Polychytrium aggregatum]